MPKTRSVWTVRRNARVLGGWLHDWMRRRGIDPRDFWWDIGYAALVLAGVLLWVAAFAFGFLKG